MRVVLYFQLNASRDPSKCSMSREFADDGGGLKRTMEEILKIRIKVLRYFDLLETNYTEIDEVHSRCCMLQQIPT